jgi:hypothetical protein
MKTQLDRIATPAEERFRPPRASGTVLHCHLRLKRPALHTRHLRGRKFDVFDVPGSERVVRPKAGSLDHAI